VKGEMSGKKEGICLSIRSEGISVVVHMKRRKKSAHTASMYGVADE